MGDVVDGIVIGGTGLTEVRLNLFGYTVRQYNVPTDDRDQYYIPLTINLLRLGLHNAYIEVDTDDAEVTIKYILYDDINIRRKLCAKKPNEAKPIEWYSMIHTSPLRHPGI